MLEPLLDSYLLTTSSKEHRLFSGTQLGSERESRGMRNPGSVSEPKGKTPTVSPAPSRPTSHQVRHSVGISPPQPRTR